MKLWPRSLAGQMALLVALALFVAQAINFALILSDRAEFRLAQATRPVATRIADALDREAQGRRPIPPDRGRVRSASGDFVPSALPRAPDVAEELRRQLRENGVEVGRIDTGVRDWVAADAGWFARGGRRLRLRAPDDQPDRALLIAVERKGVPSGWLAVVVPYGDGGAMRLFWRLLAQTLIQYVLVLLPVLWVVRRQSRPLRDLTLAAERFGPADAGAPVAVRGPADIAALVASFNALRERIVAMLDEKDRMLGAIGHDLRTPLAALRVRVESVEDETNRARMADTIHEMDRTLDDILSLARLGRPSEPPVETDLAALVDAVVEDFRDLDQPVTFIEADRLPLRLRPSLMRRAIRNLIENAVKYGGGATVSLAPAARSVAIRVTDKGPGIPDARIGEVFDAFTRLETSRNRDTGGIGLGLALARAIVREAGGEITLANRPEGGLAATITLPR